MDHALVSHYTAITLSSTSGLAVEDFAQSTSPSSLLGLPAEILQKIVIISRDTALFDAGFDLHTSASRTTWSRESARLSPTGNEWTAITHVCRAIRDLALAYAELWTVIVLEAGIEWSLAAEQRSRHLPLTIAVCSTKFGLIRVGKTFTRLLDRVLPRLEVLSLRPISDGILQQLPDVFVGRSMPMLTSLDLDHYSFSLGWSAGPFYNVRRLRLARPRFGGREEGTPLFNMLRQMPLLEEVTIVHPPWLEDGAPIFAGASVTHPSLRTLAITGRCAVSASLRLLANISLPSSVLDISSDTSTILTQHTTFMSHLQQLLPYLQRFWTQIRTPCMQNSHQLSGQEVQIDHVTARVWSSGSQGPVLEMERPGAGRVLRLCFRGSSTEYLPAFISVSAALLPLYALTQIHIDNWIILRVVASLVSGVCRVLIFEPATVNGAWVPPDNCALESLERAVFVATRTTPSVEPISLLGWLQAREDAGLRRLQALEFRGCVRSEDPEHLAAIQAIGTLVDSVEWKDQGDSSCVRRIIAWTRSSLDADKEARYPQQRTEGDAHSRVQKRPRRG
jgi:hypothetical protein